MLNSADFMTPTSFGPYTFGHQPGTSNAMAVAAATHAAAAAYSLEAANSALMHHSSMRPGPLRHDIPRGNKRERTKFDQRQLEYMERFFKTKQYPDGSDRENMAKLLALTETKVQIWFKNRRAKGRAQEFQNKRINESIAARLKQSPNSLDGMKLNGSSTTSEDSEDGLKKGSFDVDSPPPEPGQSIKSDDGLLTNNDIKLESGLSCQTDCTTDYAVPTFGSEYFDEQKDFKSFAAATNYGFALPTDPTAFANNANWMNHAYNPYNFGYFHPPYYPTPAATAATLPNAHTTAVATPMTAYPDFYSNPYPSIPGLKDTKF